MLEILVRNSLPKSKNMDLEKISSENINKELAYLFGVYLTDGCISKSKDKYGYYYNFSLRTIDIEFADRTLACIKLLIPSCRANINRLEPIDRHWPNGHVSKTQVQYCINVGFKKLKDIFWEQTNKKTHIPFVIWRAPDVIKKHFIAGVMDGDGWISKTLRPDKENIQYRIGVGKTEGSWILEFKDFLEKLGVKTLKIERNFSSGRKKVLICFGIRVESFIDHGLFFTIFRKQSRIIDFINRRSETKRCESFGIKI